MIISLSYRIPAPKGLMLKEGDKPKPPVLLQHGLIDSSDGWVTNYETRALAFILANKGYDVFLGNNRGNKYSRSHVTLNPDQNPEFWNFSLHEMGIHDLPALIEKVLEINGAPNLSYIGHSQGTSQMFAGISLNNDYYSQKINSFFALGPVAGLGHMRTNLIKVIADTHIDTLLSKMNMFEEFLPNTTATEKLEGFVCKYFGVFCDGILSLIADADANDVCQDRFYVYLSKYPAGSSMRCVHHFAEMYRTGIFKPLDSDKPYPIENIKDVKIYLFVGADDLLANVEDNRILKGYLEKNGVLKHYKEYEHYGHLSFFVAKKDDVNQDLIKMLDEVNGL